jgi:hypothetical protein
MRVIAALLINSWFEDRWHPIVDLAANSFEGTVRITNVRPHSPVMGLRQFSYKPARPKGVPSFMAIA